MPPSFSYSFCPDGRRARFLDARMRRQLADSLAYLHENIAAQWGDVIPRLDNRIRGMRDGTIYPPSSFGIYYDIANALLASQRNEAFVLIEELLSERPLASPDIVISALSDLGKNRRRYERLMDTDPAERFAITSPPAASVETFRHVFQRVRERLFPAVPSLADEMAALVRQIVLVEPAPDSGNSFAGGSCYMLWGALFLNPEACPDEVGLLEALSHESAHVLLFGFTVDEPLVLNDPLERYSSPLRDDPRPMDGIFHATYVSARMHWTLSELLKSGALNPPEIEKVQRARAAGRQSYLEGYETVQRHGKLSAPGTGILAQAHRYMTEAMSEAL